MRQQAEIAANSEETALRSQITGLGSSFSIEGDARLVGAGVTIELVAADGTVHTVKAQSASAVPDSHALSGLSSDWLTGRYQLRFANATTPDAGAGVWHARRQTGVLDMILCGQTPAPDTIK